MRRFLVVLTVLFGGATAASAGAWPASTPNSASILLHLHPRPWTPPAALARAGLRTDVDSQIEGPETPLAAELAALRAARAAALASVPVQVHPDGSRFAVLGGLVRAYAVARIGADGRLEEDCADSEADALEWLVGPAAPAAAKAGK